MLCDSVVTTIFNVFSTCVPVSLSTIISTVCHADYDYVNIYHHKALTRHMYSCTIFY